MFNPDLIARYPMNRSMISPPGGDTDVVVANVVQLQLVRDVAGYSRARPLQYHRHVRLSSGDQHRGQRAAHRT